MFVFLSSMQKLFGTINLCTFLGNSVCLKNSHQNRNGGLKIGQQKINGDFQIVVDEKKVPNMVARGG